MAYDRYETDRARPNYDRGRDRDRGFFERAGDEVASWFGDEDAERRRREDERRQRMSGDYRDYPRDRYADRGERRDWDRPSGREVLPDHGYMRSGYDPDYESRSGDRPMNWSSSERDYRPDRTRTSYGAQPDAAYGSSGLTGWTYGRDRFEGRNWRYPSDRNDDFRDTSYAGSAARDSDRHYHAWRKRQLDDLDRDYDQYRREHQERFESDFGNWRQQRLGKRQQLGSIREHMDVVGSDGETIGKVDKVRGDHVILTKSDSEDNRHHSLDCSSIETVEGDQVRLNLTADQAKQKWRDEDNNRAMFGGERDQSSVNLERSFSGTYR